jgi:CheY-like chemotaxis protein
MSHVLVVDDSDDVRRSLCETLDENGYETRIARDGLEALERIHETRPDVILLDLRMPGLDGLGVLEEMRRQGLMPGLRVILLSVEADERAFVRAFALGAVEYLTKPVDEDLLLATIRGGVVVSAG